MTIAFIFGFYAGVIWLFVAAYLLSGYKPPRPWQDRADAHGWDHVVGASAIDAATVSVLAAIGAPYVGPAFLGALVFGGREVWQYRQGRDWDEPGFDLPVRWSTGWTAAWMLVWIAVATPASAETPCAMPPGQPGSYDTLSVVMLSPTYAEVTYYNGPSSAGGYMEAEGDLAVAGAVLSGLGPERLTVIPPRGWQPDRHMIDVTDCDTGVIKLRRGAFIGM